MAKLKAPLLSLGSSGKIANTIVTASWKGLHTVREYVVPANPQTPDQTTNRTYLANAVRIWRTYFTDETLITSWNRAATADPRPFSGYNLALSSLLQTLDDDPAASYASEIHIIGGPTVRFVMINVDDGAQGDEAGNFESWSGTSPRSLLYVGTETIDGAGHIDCTSSGPQGKEWCHAIRKNGNFRSGIVQGVLYPA